MNDGHMADDNNHNHGHLTHLLTTWIFREVVKFTRSSSERLNSAACIAWATAIKNCVAVLNDS